MLGVSRWVSPRMTLVRILGTVVVAALVFGVVPAFAKGVAADEEIAGSSFTSSFNTHHKGWTPVTGTWKLVNGKYYQSAGQALTWSSIVRKNDYTDVDYQVKMKRKGCSSCLNVLTVRGLPSPLSPENGWETGYWFMFNNEGSFVVQKGVSGTFTDLSGWTASNAIKTGEQWNILRVLAVGTSLQFYINGTPVWSGTDASLAAGQVGIEFYRDDSTGNKLIVDWAKLSLPSADLEPFDGVFPSVDTPIGERPTAR